MGKLKIDQKGFSTIEGLLLLVIFAIIGATAFYVHHANKSANSTYNSASQNSQGSVSFAKNKPKVPDSIKYLRITELGIKIPLDSSTADLTYNWDSTNSTAELGSQTLMESADSADPQNCKGGNSYPIAVITTNANYAPSRTTANIKIGSKMYYWVLPGAGQGCAISAGQDFQNQLTSYADSALVQFKKSSSVQ